jgi:hypothetical protein
LINDYHQAFRARNIESAKSRLGICAEDIREQLKVKGDSEELCSQLGAVLGMLGDCWFEPSFSFPLFSCHRATPFFPLWFVVFMYINFSQFKYCIVVISAAQWEMLTWLSSTTKKVLNFFQNCLKRI